MDPFVKDSALPFLAPQPRRSDEERAHEFANWVALEYRPRFSEQLLALLAAVRAEATLAADVAKDAQIAALKIVLDAVEPLGLRKIVAGWNGEDRLAGDRYETHPADLGVTLETNCGAVYALDAAITAARAALEMSGGVL